MEKQEGFGAGLWSEIKRRHPRGRRDENAERACGAGAEPARRPRSGSHSSTTSTRVPRTDGRRRARRAREPSPAAELSRRPGSRRSAQATRERCDCSRSPAGSSNGWPGRSTTGASAPCAARTREKEQAAAQLAKLEARSRNCVPSSKPANVELAERDSSEAIVRIAVGASRSALASRARKLMALGRRRSDGSCRAGREGSRTFVTSSKCVRQAAAGAEARPSSPPRPAGARTS